LATLYGTVIFSINTDFFVSLYVCGWFRLVWAERQ